MDAPPPVAWQLPCWDCDEYMGVLRGSGAFGKEQFFDFEDGIELVVHDVSVNPFDFDVSLHKTYVLRNQIANELRPGGMWDTIGVALRLVCPTCDDRVIMHDGQIVASDNWHGIPVWLERERWEWVGNFPPYFMRVTDFEITTLKAAWDIQYDLIEFGPQGFWMRHTVGVACFRCNVDSNAGGGTNGGP